MKLNFITIFLLLTYSLPAQQSITVDLDGDNLTEKVSLINIETGFKVTYTLTTQPGQAFTTQTITTSGNKNNLTTKANTVVLKSQYPRAENVFTYQYDATLKQVKLIGYTNIQYGNAAQNGAGKLNYNLLNGAYTSSFKIIQNNKSKLVNVNKKLPLKTYLLQDLSDEQIANLDASLHKLLPKSLQ